MIRANVRLVKTKNCFINLPPHAARGISSASGASGALSGGGSVILHLSWQPPDTSRGDRSSKLPSWTFASWNGGLSEPGSGSIEVPLALARVVGLAAAVDADAYLSVRAEPAGYVPTASRVSLEPLSSNDWEIVEANADHLEGQMLTQVCVACIGQILPIWVHSTSLVALRVVSTEAPRRAAGVVGRGGPPTCVRLTADTEVAVSPKPRRQRRLREGDANARKFRPSGLLRIAPPPPRCKIAIDGNGNQGFCRPYVLAHPTTLEGIDGWTCSSRARAPWPCPTAEADFFDDYANTSPREALAVLWRDGGASGGSGFSNRGGGIGSTRGAREGGSNNDGDVYYHNNNNNNNGAAARGVNGRGDGARRFTAGSGFPPHGGVVVVVLQEDRRVPVGHLAEAVMGLLRRRAGLVLLRRTARVRLLSASEGAERSPRMVFSRIIARDEASSVGHPAAANATTAAASTPTLPSRASEHALQALRHALREVLLPTDNEIETNLNHVNGEEDSYVGEGERGEGGIVPENTTTDRGQYQHHWRGRTRRRAGEEHKHCGYDDRSLSDLVENRHRDLCCSNSRGGHAPAFSSPLVLDGGAVVSLPMCMAAPSGGSVGWVSESEGTRYSSNRSGAGGARGGAVAVWDYVVSFAATRTTPGFPSARTEASSTAQGSRDRDGFESGEGSGVLGNGTGSGPAGGVMRYAMITCEEDLKTLVDEAAIGTDVLVKSPGGGELEERNGGEAYRAVGCSGGYGLGGVDKQMRTISNHLAPILVRSVARARTKLGVVEGIGGVVLHGAPGSGKTAIALVVAERLREAYASLAGTEMVSCGDLLGRKMSEVLGALEEAFSSAARHAPSLVVLDDLDKLAPTEEEDAGPFNSQAGRIAERIEDLLNNAAESTAAVGVLATAASPTALHPRLRRSGLLDIEVEIPPPRPATRVSILKALVRGLGAAPCAATSAAVASKGYYEDKGEEIEVGEGGDDDAEGIDWEFLAFKTEGCQARDLSKLVKRALLQSALRRMKEEATDAPEARDDFEPLLPRLSKDFENPAVRGPEGEAVALVAHVKAGINGHPNGLIEAQQPQCASAKDGGSTRDSEDLGDGQRFCMRSGVGGAGGERGNSRFIDRGVIEMQDMETALEGFSAESLHGAGLFRSGVEWEDVGGLQGVRAELREILELPVKYGRLFEATPTRLPTGALLYGPPGCGKTLLAGAAAAECGLNFISVKGPEVLDKYIGASEQAVRSLFARAASASPCVVFFDEFEAVAPRRGNDNTGVTDRVVNQLLTFLDGVEGRDDVYVLGATSRPDLIDPALLRPGRLDRQLYCGFPDEVEREDILWAVSRKTPMTEEARTVALARVARSPKAAGFTGADLHAVVDAAQLAAIHGYLDALGKDGEGKEEAGVTTASTENASRSPYSEATLRSDVHLSSPQDRPSRKALNAGGNLSNSNAVPPFLAAGVRSSDEPAAVRSGKGVEVSAENLWEALLSTRPSLTSEDRAQYDSAYRKFRGGSRKADFNPVSSVDDGTLRTALK